MAGYNAKKKTGATASSKEAFDHPHWMAKKARQLNIPNWEKLTVDELKTAITDRIREDKNAQASAQTSEPAPSTEASKEVAKDVAFAGAPIRETGGVYINVAAPTVPATIDYVKTYSPAPVAPFSAYTVAREIAWWCQAAIVGAALWALIGKPVGAVLAQATITGGM